MINEDLTTMTSQDLNAKVYALRLAAGSENVEYKTAEKNAQPYLDELNRRAETIAKKFNKKAQRFSFKGFGRNVRVRY